MNKVEFLEALHRERVEWDALLAQFTEEQMLIPGVNGAWSIKDMIAHVSWYEEQMVGMLQAHALVGSELWNFNDQIRNAEIFEQNRHRPLNEVREESLRVFQELVAEVEALDEEDLHDAARFPNMPDDWIPWEVIAENSFTHYPQHSDDVRAWLERLNQAS